MSERLVSGLAFKPMYYGIKNHEDSLAEDLLNFAGISGNDLNNSLAKIPAEKYYEAWKFCEHMSGDKLFGLHVGETMHPSSLGVLGYAIMNCRTVYEALLLTIDVNPYQNVTVRNDVRIQDGNVILELSTRHNADKVRPWVEMCLAGYRNLFHVLTNNQHRRKKGGALNGGHYSYIEVGFMHQAGGCIEDYHRAYGCDVLFSQESNYAVFSLELANLPVFMADDKTLNGFLRQLGVKNEHGRFTTDIRRYIKSQLVNGLPNQEQVAKYFGLSRATLTRRVKSEGTTFRQISELLRKEIAEDLINKRDLTLSEVGFRLGYSNPSAFFRAFKAWTGKTPSDYRSSMKCVS